MGNRGSFKTRINGKLLLEKIQKCGYSIRKLANEPEISRTEKTIRNALKTDEIPVELLYKICRVLDADMREFTLADEKDAGQSDSQIEVLARYYTLLKLLLSTHGVSMHEFQELDKKSRHQMIDDLECGIIKTIFNFFPGRESGILRESNMREIVEALDDDQEEYKIIHHISARGFMNLGFDDFLPNDNTKLE